MGTSKAGGARKLCALVDEEDDTLALHAERHILYVPETTQVAEVENAAFSAVICADELERCVFQTDQVQADLFPEDAGGLAGNRRQARNSGHDGGGRLSGCTEIVSPEPAISSTKRRGKAVPV
jgi:hypothetical protein